MRPGDFFAIAAALTADGFAEDPAAEDLNPRIEKMGHDLCVAESWESMATRAAVRVEERELVPILARRRPCP